MKKAIIIVVFALVCAAPAHAFETKGFVHPYGVTMDPATKYIYVSSMNGPGEKKDDNGFISKVKPDGTVDLLKFIDGMQGLVQLNAPKGMAVIGNFLYVCDIDAIRVFDLANGKQLFNVNFGHFKVKHFYEAAIGPDGALYVTDGPANTVYRIDVMHEHRVTVFVKDEALGQPHGIEWYALRQVFLIGGWKSGQIFAYDRKGKRKDFTGIFLSSIEGIAADMRGNVYIASTSLNSIFRMAANGALFPYVSTIETPLGLAYHPTEKIILAVSYRRNSLQSYLSAK